MNKLRLSYSLLTLWNNGRWTDAVKMYFHEKTEKSDQMKQGLEYHAKWESEIKKTKKLKIGKATIKFETPKTELKKIVSYNEKWDLSGTFDCLDKTTLYEFKTGVASSMEYTNNNQLPLYFLIAELDKTPIEKGVLIRYNQYMKEADMTVLWNSRELVEKARNFVDSLAPEVEQYFIDHNLPFNK
jgi:hypothetical protein